MRSFVALGLLFAAIQVQAAGAKVYCLQVSPSAAQGYIIEEMLLEVSSGKPVVETNSFGVGILGPQGDGTVSNRYIELASSRVAADPSLQAKSADWKNAVPFPWIYKNGQIAILYIQPEAFKSAKEFAARIKEVNRQGKETKSVNLRCNLI